MLEWIELLQGPCGWIPVVIGIGIIAVVGDWINRLRRKKN